MKKIYLALLMIFVSLSYANASCTTGNTEIIVQIVPDSWPNEISWQLAIPGTGIIQSGGSVGDTICVPTGTCLEFTIFDSYGDGIYTPGGFWLYVDTQLVAHANAYGHQDMVALNCPAGMHCTNPLPISYGNFWAVNDDSWYSFTPDSSGMYSLSTCDSNSCNTQLWVYTTCPGMPYTEGPMGSYVYNDDNNCGTQANMTFQLVAGTPYIIRVGDNLNDCADSVNFSFSYSGPIHGCTDPTACNYNPLATVSDTCMYYPNPICQGPDLQFDSLTFVNSLSLSSMTASTCDVAEGCVTGYGTRYVISFTSKINNIGTLDYYIGNPSSQPGMFNSNNCHGHAHYEGYGDYRLYDSTGHVVPAGHKNGYCVIDLCGMGQYTCGNMGISAGCYDAYGAGTQCQWVDITDVPDGDYRLAVIINSQHLPDALGRYETNFANNVAQACIRITRNGAGVPTYSLLPNCSPYTDCNGLPAGTAMQDCNGVCGGPALTGDLNADGVINSAEINTYMDQVQSGMAASPCNDLNADGSLTVFDVAQMNWCIYGNPVIPGGTHNHCNFPRDIINLQDTTELRILAHDPVNQFVDIGLKNPRCSVKGYQFTMSGITISSCASLVNPVFCPVDIRYIAADNQVLAFALNDSMIHNSVLGLPLARIYYSTITDTIICISHVTAVMNENAEGTVTVLNNNCVPVSTTAINAPQQSAELLLMPNPANSYVTLHLKSGVEPGNSVILMDVNGRSFQVKATKMLKDWFTLDISELPTGLYLIRIAEQGCYGVARLVKL